MKAQKIDLVSIALTILSIFYLLFSILALFRLVKILREKSILYISIVFYIGLCISAITRGSTLFFISNDYVIKKDLMYLLLIIPDMVYLCVFLVLIWHFLMTYVSSHIRLANDGGVFGGSDEPGITKKIQYVLSVVMPIYIITFITLSLLNYFNILSYNDLFYINAGFNMGTPVLFVSFLVVLKINFSGRPYKSKEEKLETRDLLILTWIWSADRITIAIFHLILITLGYLQDFIENYAELASKFLYPVVCVLFFIVTELVPDYFVLDYSTMMTFVKKKPDLAALSDGLLTNGSNNSLYSDDTQVTPSVVMDINTLKISYKDLILNQQVLHSKKRGLGFMKKGTYKGQAIVCREIIFERISRYDQEGIYADIDSILKLNNKNLSPLVGFCVENDTNIYIVTHYYKQGSLFDYLHSKSNQIAYREKITIAIAVAQGIKYLHNNNIYHCHLSSCNILLDDNLNPLIADYGFDNLKTIASIFNKYTNKNSYSSPEILQDAEAIGQKPTSKKNADKIDIYSFGILLWELLTQTIPFNVKLSELINYVVEKNSRPEIPKEVDKNMTGLIRACWDTEPKSRPGIDEVILKLQEKLIGMDQSSNI